MKILHVDTRQDLKSNDLADFMNNITREMSDEYNRIQKRALEDPGTAGDQGEENWATLLREWLPSTFHVVTKGRILSSKGNASPQVDVIVLRPEYPKKLLDKKLFLSGGVLAAFECKVTLKAEHIETFIKNSIAIEAHTESRKGTQYRDSTPFKEIQSPIIYGLLAHSHSWKGESSTPVINILNKLIECDNTFITHPIQMPDIVCVADLACWSSFKVPFLGPAQVPHWLSTPVGHTNGLAQTSYLLNRPTDQRTAIGAMITSLLMKLAWEYSTLRPLAKYFQEAGLQGVSEGSSRNWTSEIYSDRIRDKVMNRPLTGEGEYWNEWRLSFP